MEGEHQLVAFAVLVPVLSNTGGQRADACRLSGTGGNDVSDSRIPFDFCPGIFAKQNCVTGSHRACAGVIVENGYKIETSSW